MAMKPLRPCRHPGCQKLTREGWCPKHKPKRAERRVSAQWHGWYNLTVWTDDLRPNQLMREPWCRECARRGITSSPTGVTGPALSTGTICRACASPATIAKLPSKWRRKNGKTGGVFSARNRQDRRDAWACATDLPAHGKPKACQTLPRPGKVWELKQDRTAPSVRDFLPTGNPEARRSPAGGESREQAGREMGESWGRDGRQN